MSLFACSKCGVVENTALCRFWMRGSKPPLCSQCDPDVAKWHDRFPRELAADAGYVVGPDGYLHATRKP